MGASQPVTGQTGPDPSRRQRSSIRPGVPIAVASALGRPVSLAGQRLLEVVDPLAELLPEGGLRRGATLSVSPGTGSISLALALTVAASRAGCWIAVVGLPTLGLVAADQMGAALDRLVLVPSPGEQWAMAAAALLEGVDMVLVCPPGRIRATDARRLSARARERAAVLVVLPSTRSPWPEVAEVVLSVGASRWEGLGAGYGHLRARLVEVVVTGRRAAARPRRRLLWLPGSDGRIGEMTPQDASGPPLKLADIENPIDLERPRLTSVAG